MTAKQLSEEEELAILFPEAVPFPIPGTSLSIALAPMDIATYVRFMAKARPIVLAALGMPPGEDIVVAVVVAMMRHPEEAIAALAIATGKSEAFIGRLRPTVCASLARKIMDVNRDSFGLSVVEPGSDAQVKSPDRVADGVGVTH